jgi:HlyD family secretion protein
MPGGIMPTESQTEVKKGPKRRARALKTVDISLSVILIVLLAIYIFRFHLRGDGDPGLSVPLSDLTIVAVKLGPLREFLTVEGTIQPLNTVFMDAVEGGRVEKIFAEVGSVVKEGAPILQLANTNLLMDIMYREAELFQQSNNLRNTKLSMEQYKLQLNQQLSELDNQLQQQRKLYERYKELDKDSLISKQDFEQARDQYEYLLKRKDLMEKSQKSELALRTGQLDALEESLRRMETNLESVKQKQENLTIKAPIGGQITSLNADIGQLMSAGQRIGQIDVLSGFKAMAAIDELYLSRIEVNTAGEFDFAGHSFNLVVKKIYPEVKDRKFLVELEFRGERPKGIRRGQTLDVRIALGEISKALVLPNGEYLKTTEGEWVYRVDETGKAALKNPIKLGRRNADVVEVAKGLKPGDRVIISSYTAFAGRDKILLKDK